MIFKGTFVRRIFYVTINYFLLLLTSIISSKSQSKIRYLSEYFGLKIPKAALPKIKFSDLSCEDAHVDIYAPNLVDGNISTHELLIVCSLIKKYRPINLFEIGTFDGRTALNMAANSSPESRVYTLDIADDLSLKSALTLDLSDTVFIKKKVLGQRFSNSKFKEKIVQLLGDSGIFDFTNYFNKMDFVFIDGSHSYSYVMNDSKMALKLLSNKGGVIIWHDYDAGRDGVTMALNDLYLSDKHFSGLKHIEGTSLVLLDSLKA